MSACGLHFFIPDYIQTALRTLEAAGFEAYLVGGCVRDALMGVTPEDYDITTSALPEQIKALFGTEYKTIDTGMKHGTVAPIIEGHAVEITTFRIDGSYSDNRHPDSVRFSAKLFDDLSRRDFTVNAMAFSPTTGLADCFGGQEDLQKRCIRCVGEADKRFGEDALRMLRALRFSAVLGFTVEEQTANSIHKNIGSILNVSAERIYSELKKLLAGDNCAAVLRRFPCLLQTVLGITPSPTQLAALEPEATVGFRLAVLFIGEDCGRLKSLKPDNKTFRYCSDLVRLYAIPLGMEQASPGALFLGMRAHQAECATMEALLELHRRMECAFAYEALCESLAEARLKNLPLTAAELALSGEDLKKSGFSGREIGEKTEQLITAVLAGRCENTRGALLAYLSEE